MASALKPEGKLALLAQVGYPVQNVEVLKVALRAYHAAESVRQTLRSLGGEEVASTGDLTDASLIPNAWDLDALIRDTATLTQLLESEAALRRLRFPGKDAADFFAHAVKRAGARNELPDPEDAREFMDQISADYGNENGTALMNEVGSRLAEVARPDLSADELRGLALGIYYVEDWKEEPREVNPLVATLFRLSIQDFFDGLARAEARRRFDSLKSGPSCC